MPKERWWAGSASGFSSSTRPGPRRDRPRTAVYATPSPRFRPEGHPMTLDWTTIRVGDPIRPLELEMTATRIVAGAIATRDFMPVHHDRAYANSQGAPDIFMNILSSTAYCSRFLTDWAGSDAMITKLAVRIGVPVFPDSTLRFTG